MRRRTWEAAWRAHLQVPEAELAAEQLMLLPHVLLQVPEEAEGRPLGTVGALVLQQLPGKTPGQPPQDTQRHRPQGAQGPTPTPQTPWERAPGGWAPRPPRQTVPGPGPEPKKAPGQETAPTWKTGTTPKTTIPPMGFFLYR